jgi:hypothetical protein
VSKIALILTYWPGTVALGIILIFFRLRLVFNIFPFPVTTAKLIGKFYNNRRSAANQCLRFAYSFVLLMLRQYYWHCDSYTANRRSAANMKNPPKILLLALRKRPASPKGEANPHRFAYKRRAQCRAQRSANINSSIFYIAPLLLALRRLYRFTYFSRTRL